MPNDQFFYRSFEIDARALNHDTRSVPVTFSSEAPVNRWFGAEYLLHGEKNIDLRRLRSMGSALFNHDPNTIVGPVRKVSLDRENRVARAEIVFDDDDDGNRAMRKVASGSLRGVSVGYQIESFREVLDGEEYQLEDGRTIKGPAMLATRWAPYEISLTPIPADASVGVGRSATRSLEGIDIINRSTETKEQDMERTEVEQIVADALKRKEEAQAGTRITAAELSRLIGRAAAVSADCIRSVVELADAGKLEAEILRHIADEAIKRMGRPDAAAIPPAGGDGQPQSRKLDQMDDDEFLRMLTNPSLMPAFDD